MVLCLNAKELSKSVGVQGEAFSHRQGGGLGVKRHVAELVFGQNSAQIGTELAQRMKSFGGRGVGVAGGEQQVTLCTGRVHPTLHPAVDAVLVGA